MTTWLADGEGRLAKVPALMSEPSESVQNPPSILAAAWVMVRKDHASLGIAELCLGTAWTTVTMGVFTEVG